MTTFISNVKNSFTTYDNDLIQKETIFKNANQKLTYLYLVSYANAHKIFPSMDSIASAICSTKRTAMTVIQQLEEMKLIEVKRTKGFSNHYVLHDYFEVASENPSPPSEKISPVNTSEKISPVKKFHQGSEKISPVPVKNFHSKTNNLKIKDKNNNSTNTTREDIENELKLQFPNVPFEEVKEKMLQDIESDSSITIKTLNQYKGFLRSRLSNWKPNLVPTSKKKATRTELLPDWFDTPYTEPERTPEELVDIERRRKELEERLSKYKRKSS